MTAVADTSIQALLGEMVQIVGEANVLTDPDLTGGYRRDMQPLAEAGTPLAVVRPATTAEVAAIVKACAKAGIPLVPRGAGSGLTGASNAVDGAVTISFTRMNGKPRIDRETRLAVVQPGVTTLELKQAAEEQGLFYAPDPTSNAWCTIGGNLANASGGPCASKYGVTADRVRGLEVVLASGEVLRTGSTTLKNVSGYDLNRLFVGSEGTLGLITEATLALQAKPPAPRTAVAAFPTTEAAGRSVTEFLATGHLLSLLEIMDGPCIRAVETYLGSPILGDDVPSPGAVLFAQSDTGQVLELEAFEELCAGNGAVFTYATDYPSEGELLLQYWHSLEPALEAMGTWILHEVTVLPRHVSTLIDKAAGIAEDTGLFIGVHGHAADGTLHPMIVFTPGHEDELCRARQAYGLVLQAAVELGGPVSGEHGIGRIKAAHLGEEIGETGLAVHRAIKKALDPQRILNPGSMFQPAS
ncbi:FAD-binding protein [Arthrobacter sp. I2-34]|uniref:FAD-binding protein n=1 Tax=Arthrobacter hankyongi TaxID=2904801 RepID=A0ABS9LEP6_9MICC|nr:FAD-linked oxidase C-terminal domain-containing protein [Arthrobacter hankyongi]MCG2624929.1 FAD-binding protein [Arthrobacter hankyongi]